MIRLRARNQGGWLVKTTAGEYQAHWYEYVLDPESGEKRRRHRSRILGEVKRMTKVNAEKELQKIVEPINGQACAQQDGRVTFSWFVDKKFLPVKKAGWAETTKKANLYDIEKYIRPALGELALNEIDIAALQCWLSDLAEGKFSSCTLSEWVVDRCKRMVRSILDLADELEYIDRSPARSKHYRRPVCKPTSKETLTRAEIGTLCTSIPDPRDRLIMRVGSLGTNAGETFGLTWGCVFPDRIEIRATAFNGKLREWRVKRKARMRVVPITPGIYKAFEEWRAASGLTTPKSLVFPGVRRRRKGVVDVRDQVTMAVGTFLQKRIKPIALKLGITTPVNFQTLRRSFATWNKGKLRDAQTVLGHADIATTANVYAQDVDVDAAQLVLEYEAEVMKAARESTLGQKAFETWQARRIQ